MGNRVLRFDPVNFPPENFIRVIFRDENYDRVYRGKVPTSMINEFVGNTIKAGFVVAGIFSLIANISKYTKC
jgi:hypothetical protein